MNVRLAPLVLIAACAAVPVEAPPPALPRSPHPPGAPHALRFPLPDATTCSRAFDPAARHFALDIIAAAGTPARAAAAGVVVRAAPHADYGRMVIVRHARGLYTLYAHLRDLRVSAGERVDAGDVIGDVGHTGNATGDHLHWEVVRAPEDLPFRDAGATGIPGDAYRIDPASVVPVPASCARVPSRLSPSPPTS